MGVPSEGSDPGGPSTPALVFGFATLYIVWGSTYLAIKIAIETLPPFLMAGSRFVLAGVILLAWARLRGLAMPTRKQWRNATITGGLMLLGGNGGVVWAEKTVPTGLCALLVSTLPVWMALLVWLRPGGERPALTTWVGILVGVAGMAFLAGGGRDLEGQPVSLLGVGVLLGANIAWALGSLIARHADKPASSLVGSGAMMLAGGGWLLLVSAAAREPQHFNPADVTLDSLLATLYLVVAGSLLALSVYNWLLQVTHPTLVSTYAFVNPVIAVLLGWLFLREKLTPGTVAAGGLIVAAVAWLVGVQWWKSRRQAVVPCTRPAAAR